MKPLPADAQLAVAIQRVVPAVQAAWLFGSASSGRLRADSDIDIAVLHDAPLDASTRLRLSNALADEWGRDVDLLDLLRMPTAMQLQVLQGGRALFAQNPLKVLNLQAMVLREFQDMQTWREPMIRALAARLQGMPV
jgi:predicted nucleotidyltransferase